MKEYIEWITLDETLTDGERVMLLYLSEYRRHSEYFAITNAELCEALNYSFAKINRGMKALEEAGYITRIITVDAYRKEKRLIQWMYKNENY